MLLRIIAILGAVGGGLMMLNAWASGSFVIAIIGGAVWTSAFIAGCTADITDALKIKK